MAENQHLRQLGPWSTATPAVVTPNPVPSMVVPGPGSALEPESNEVGVIVTAGGFPPGHQSPNYEPIKGAEILSVSMECTA